MCSGMSFKVSRSTKGAKGSLSWKRTTLSETFCTSTPIQFARIGDLYLGSCMVRTVNRMSSTEKGFPSDHRSFSLSVSSYTFPPSSMRSSSARSGTISPLSLYFINPANSSCTRSRSASLASAYTGFKNRGEPTMPSAMLPPLAGTTLVLFMYRNVAEPRNKIASRRTVVFSRNDKNRGSFLH